MGCHALALDLVRSWSFERPQAGLSIMQQVMAPPSPKATRNVFSFEPVFRHRPSILIDMSVSSPPTPALVDRPSKAAEDSADLVARKTGIGNLMRTAKKDVEIPDFDMNAFSMLS